MFTRVLVAIDGSPTADRGLQSAIELAADQRAKLFIVHVLDDLAVAPTFDGSLLPAAYYDRMIEAMREAGHELLAKAERLARERRVEVQTRFIETLGQTVAHAILAEAAKEKVDVIVLGTHGRRGVRRLVLGSDAEAVLREARVPVLLLRGPEDERQDARPIEQGAASAASGSSSEKRLEPRTRALP
jgi:nucleotide-binding universal stress UspA family protein